MSANDLCSSFPLSSVMKQSGEVQEGLYCMRRATGRLVFVPPPTYLRKEYERIKEVASISELAMITWLN
jgi:hypothetical protein